MLRGPWMAHRDVSGPRGGVYEMAREEIVFDLHSTPPPRQWGGGNWDIWDINGPPRIFVNFFGARSKVFEKNWAKALKQLTYA